MRNHFTSAMRRLRPITLALIALCLVLLAVSPAASQCVVNPTGETAVGLKNDSSYFLTLYIDNVSQGGVPSGDRSIDFIVSPGSHTLRAEAVIDTEIISASRPATVPAGYVCTWTVTDPPKVIGNTQPQFQDYLRLEMRRAFITLAVPN